MKQILTTSKEERDAVLALLLGFGIYWHEDPNLNLDHINEEYSYKKYPIVNVHIKKFEPKLPVNYCAGNNNYFLEYRISFLELVTILLNEL